MLDLPMKPGPLNAITDVSGIQVGHYTDLENLTGVTVIFPENGAVAGVDVRGSAPGTRETDLLNPVNLVEQVQAIVLSGGSAGPLDCHSGTGCAVGRGLALYIPGHSPEGGGRCCVGAAAGAGSGADYGCGGLLSAALRTKTQDGA
jgi:L-aminopeptidase/D-esterase-like protein